MAAPHVAGAWALLRDHDPSASVADHLASVQTTGVPVTDSRGSTSFTTPRIAVYDAAFADGAPPDLRVTVVSDPPGWQTQGAGFTVTDTTTDDGGSPAAESRTRSYLSADQVHDGSDRLLSGPRVVAALPGGTSSTGSQAVTIPSTTPSGTYYLLACADDTGAVAESDEANNCRSSRGQIRVSAPLSDLEVSVSNPPASASPGTTFSVTDTTANTGSASAVASRTRFYLSGGSRASPSPRWSADATSPRWLPGRPRHARRPPRFPPTCLRGSTGSWRVLTIRPSSRKFTSPTTAGPRPHTSTSLPNRVDTHVHGRGVRLTLI